MRLTAVEEQQLDRAAQLLEETQQFESLNSQQLPLEPVLTLMSSDKPDMATMGCYLASRADSSVDFSPLERQEASSRNYARLLLAKQPLSRLLSPERAETFRIHATSLNKRIPVSATAAAPAAATPSLTMIVHGTFARTSPWWQNGGNFWSYINTLVRDLYHGPTPYSWSGGNSHSDREIGAADLVTWLQLNPTSHLRIIAHSHGGNVCLLATRLGLKINELITLGTPIRLEYLPDLRQIEMLHNVFSTVDRIQTPTGTIPNKRGEGRTLGEGDNVLNHRATDDGTGSQPGHIDLHEPATWKASGLFKLL